MVLGNARNDRRTASSADSLIASNFRFIHRNRKGFVTGTETAIV